MKSSRQRTQLAGMAFVAAVAGAMGVVGLSACDSSRGGHKFDMSTGTLPGPVPEDDAGSAYDLGGSDSGACMPGQMPNMCTTPIGGDGCKAVEDCGPSGAGNGADDNCDGQVDEGCSCTSGDVQKCFVGPPGRRGVGACTDGTQTCTGGEIGFWGPCTGGLAPAAEGCDNVDNDCNGCVDDGLCCGGELMCPTSVPDSAPYSDVKYTGMDYFKGAAVSWTWTVQGGPCDQLFLTTTGSPPAQSFTITGGTTANPTMHFTLSGDYTVTMTATDSAGNKSTCTWVQHVSGPGVRFELCWDTTGSSDLDLHVHKPNTTTDFFKTSGGADSADDCNYRNCPAGSSGAAVPSWGYSTSPLAECSGGPEGFLWTLEGSCRNPRLDMDNIITVGGSENINIDNPKNNDSFRALVHYFDGTKLTKPMVNIYCGGHIKATYGQAPDTVSGYMTSGEWAAGDMWRVADVKAIVDASGVTTDCDVTAVHPIGMTTGYRVGHDSKISFEGN
jgi:hypothetical protein